MIAGACVLGLAASAQAGTVYTSDFESALGSEWSIGGSAGRTPVQGFSSLGGFSGSLLYNQGTQTLGLQQPSTLTLTGLSTHTTVSLDFLLGIIGSWDGTNGTVAPDYFVVRLGDGTTMTTVFQATFAIGSGSGSYVGPSMSGAANSSSASHLQNAFDGLTVEGYDLGHAAAGLQSLAHTSGTLVVQFHAAGNGWQGGSDEFWGSTTCDRLDQRRRSGAAAAGGAHGPARSGRDRVETHPPPARRLDRALSDLVGTPCGPPRTGGPLS